MDRKKVWLRATIKSLEDQFTIRAREFKYPATLQAFQTFKDVVNNHSFMGVWGKRQASEFYSRLPASFSNPEDEFRVNISLAYIFKVLLRHGGGESYFKVTSWPKVNLYPRSNLAVNKHVYVYADIELYEAMLVQLCQFSPNQRMDSTELSIWLVLRLIAVDGILIGEADKNISQIRSDMVHEADGHAWLGLPVGKGDEKSLKQYPISPNTMVGLKMLKRRSVRCGEKNGYLFPEALRLSKNKKKTRRRLLLEKELNHLCYTVNQEHIKHGKLDIQWWVQMSQQHMEIKGVPYLCIANMRNKVRIAQLLFQSMPKKKNNNTYLKSLKSQYEVNLLRSMQRQFRKYIDGKRFVHDVRQTLRVELSGILERAKSLEQAPMMWQQLFNWILHLAEADEFSQLKVSTLSTHAYSIPNRVFPHLGVDDMRSLTKDDWLKLASKIASDTNYEASSRTTTMTHLKRFYYYLYNHDQGVPEINWAQVHLKVHRDIAEGFFVTPKLFDEIIEKIDKNSVEWFALFLAYHIGLRCEEIFHLSKLDFRDWERLPVLRSKTDAGYRVVPLASFLTMEQETALRIFLSRKEIKDKIVSASFVHLKSPQDLSRKVARSMKRLGFSGMSLHTFRHSFASLQLVRYFALIDPNLIDYLQQELPDIPLSLLQGSQMKELAFVFGGSRWAHDFEVYGMCSPKPTDLVILSKLMGHTSRKTTLENYCNSFFWLQRYWMLNREKKLLV